MAIVLCTFMRADLPHLPIEKDSSGKIVSNVILLSLYPFHFVCRLFRARSIQGACALEAKKKLGRWFKKTASHERLVIAYRIYGAQITTVTTSTELS